MTAASSPDDASLESDDVLGDWRSSGGRMIGEIMLFLARAIFASTPVMRWRRIVGLCLGNMIT